MKISIFNSSLRLKTIRPLGFGEKCQVVVLLAGLNGSPAIWGIAAQAGHSTEERGHEMTQAVESFKSISPTQSEKININLASVEELRSLPGIGAVTAKRIVDYRKRNPPFRKVEELIIIKGISKNRLEQIRKRITVN
jgi:competence ComEA-like helix-hairpin-helix protein